MSEFEVNRLINLRKAIQAEKKIGIFLVRGLRRAEQPAVRECFTVRARKDFSNIAISTAMLQLSPNAISLLVDGEWLSAVEYRERVAQRVAECDVSIGVSFSAGAFAGLAAGIFSGVQRMAVFSPIISLSEEAAQIDERVGALRDSILRLGAPALRGATNIADLIKAQHYRGRIVVYYPRSRAVDAYHAKQLAGFPRVRLHPVDTNEHAFWMNVGTGRLLSRLTNLPIRKVRDGEAPSDDDEALTDAL